MRNIEKNTFVALFNPRTSVTKIATIIKIFRISGFVLFFVILRLLITINRKIVTKGNRNPFSPYVCNLKVTEEN